MLDQSDRGAALERIPALTGLRLFAASAIVLWHSQTGYFFAPGAFSPFYLAGAVPLFFVLSGFVLTLGRSKYQGWRPFIVARIARIWPAHAAAIVFLFAIFWPFSRALVSDAASLLTLGANLFLLHAWVPDRAVYWSLNAPSWSVSCELFFYAMFPLCLAALGRAPVWCATAALVSALLLIATVEAAWPGIDGNWLVTNPITALPAFLVGIAAGLLHQGRPPRHAASA
jgi:peptidoglycan/LPS O-acetylase OafA/YrhL